MTLRGKRVLVTGGTGFIGGHLVEFLLTEGCEVYVLSRSIDPFSFFSSQELSKHSVVVLGDIKDYPRVLNIVTQYDIEFIFHLAAQSIVPTAYIHPMEAFGTNIQGTVNILEASRVAGNVQGIIVASSDKAYGKSSQEYDESFPIRGDHPYDVSKSSADLIAQTYSLTYKLPVVITRFGNVFGEGDRNFSRIFPGIFRSLVTQEPLQIRSNGQYVRAYLYVKDVVGGYAAIVRNFENVLGEAFNFGSVYTPRVIDVIGDIETLLGVSIPYTINNSAHNEIPTQRLSYEKARELLDWNPRYGLEDVVVDMKEWYVGYFRKIFTQQSTLHSNTDNNGHGSEYHAGFSTTLYTP